MSKPEASFMNYCFHSYRLSFPYFCFTLLSIQTNPDKLLNAGKQGHEYQEGGSLGSFWRLATIHGYRHRLLLIPLYVKAAH